MIEIRCRATLLDKKVKIDGEMRDVYGLSRLDIRPRRIGMGMGLIRWMTMLAGRDGKWGIVAFTGGRTWDFYRKCGWHKHGTYEDQIIITSVPCSSIEVTERW